MGLRRDHIAGFEQFKITVQPGAGLILGQYNSNLVIVDEVTGASGVTVFQSS